MLKRERSPDQRVIHPQSKQCMRNGESHISEPAFDGSYGSSNVMKRMVSYKNEQESVSNGCECHVHGCSQSFASVEDYEDHYNVCHRFICRYCQRFYQTNHLLEIHLAESHDSFFSLLSQQQPMYRCLEERCNDRFMDARGRLGHLTSCHGYPANFSFDRRQHLRLVDVSGGLEESRDVESGAQKKNRICLPPQTRVPDVISFGIGGSELFQSQGS
ncbi:zinc finger protein 511-like [Lytechinus variegatus]|uniref:zinc finger protein 511-like n=1 Tax=Lytechinus variegatus TaxID=7654 RepID=UPI001BB26C2B|nr:zinc finger protein 511-like [Lytechinus variegatus]XP_041470703.1 zinc finger protein 511-like [Lytechinus variegatus]